MGRPAAVLPPLEVIEKLATRGLTEEQIAHAIGIHRDTLTNHKKRNSELSEAIKRGRAKGIAKVSNALFEAAISGNVTAMIFYLKNRAPNEWSDRHEVTAAGGSPLVPVLNVTIAGAVHI